MPIYEYNEDEHAGGFIGLRVAVMVGGNFRQQYYSYVKKQGGKNTDTLFKNEKEIALLLKDANKLDKQWLIEQRKMQHLRQTFGPPLNTCINPQWDTGIRGLTCRYKISDHKQDNKRLVFSISIFSTNDKGEKLQASRNIMDESTIETVWRDMAKQLALSRGLKRMPSKWMLALPNNLDRKKMFKTAKKQYLAA